MYQVSSTQCILNLNHWVFFKLYTVFVINTVLSDTYWVGCKTSALTLFLWFVSVTLDLPAAKSHRRIVQSWLPVITYKIQNSIKPLKNEPCTDWWNLTIEWLHFQPSPHFMDLWMAWTVCMYHSTKGNEPPEVKYCSRSFLHGTHHMIVSRVYTNKI